VVPVEFDRVALVGVRLVITRDIGPVKVTVEILVMFATVSKVFVVRLRTKPENVTRTWLSIGLAACAST
jgi:hypothetical protein